MKIISGTSNLPLAKSIAKLVNLPMIEVEVSEFANGEKRVWIKDEEVRGENIALVQSFSHPTDVHIMEFLLLADALERMGVRHVNLILPWMGYSLQDKVFRSGEPIAAKVVANLISHAYVKRAFLLDLHNSSTPGFFSIPVQHLSAMDLFVKYVKENFDLKSLVIASPDFGGLKRARVFANKLNLELVNIDKDRDLATGETQALGMKGEVDGKQVIVFDDIINTGSTVVTTAEWLKAHGAHTVHFFSTHGPLVESGLEKIAAAPVDSVVITNTINQPIITNKIKVLDVAPIFASELKTWI